VAGGDSAAFCEAVMQLHHANITQRSRRRVEMAGEWIPVDLSIGTKPEILELVDIASVSVEVAVYRVFQMWGWFSLNSADGTAKTTPERLARVCGGDAQFWRDVERVGWIEFDEAAQTARLPGWGSRFSRAAKSRANHAKAQRRFRQKQQSDACVMMPHHESDAHESPEEKREEEKTKEEIALLRSVATGGPKRGRPAAPKIDWSIDAGWQGITADDRAGWAKAYPGADLDTELARATEWLKANPSKAGKRNWRSFVVRWLQRCQDNGGTQRAGQRFGQFQQPAPQDQAKRRWYRQDAQKSMTDSEYAVWRRDSASGGMASSLGAALRVGRAEAQSPGDSNELV
jgi:hypothetical protein